MTLYLWIVQNQNISNSCLNALRVLKKGGVLMVDDIFQGGTILLSDEEIPRGKRAIHRKLNEFLRVVMEHPDLTSTLLPLGDGVILITKEAETIDL